MAIIELKIFLKDSKVCLEWPDGRGIRFEVEDARKLARDLSKFCDKVESNEQIPAVQNKKCWAWSLPTLW